MALESPTLPELITRIIGDIDSRLPELLVRIPQNPANVFATAVAGLTYGAYGYIDKQVLQILPTTADEVGLSEWARVTQTPRKAATKAIVPVSMPITTLGTVISDGTTFRRDDGALFEVTEDLTASSDPYTFEVTAVEAGESYTVTSGTVLKLTQYKEGLGTQATATADGEGEDIENLELWRGRILEALRDADHGSAKADYIRWAKEVEGVGQAWVIDSIPPFVDIRIVSNDEEDLEAGAPLIASVQAYMDDDDRKPVNAVPLVDSATVTAQPFTFGALSPNNAATQAAITAALTTLLKAIRTPGRTLYRNEAIAAVVNTGVVTSFTLTVPSGDVSYGTVEIPTLGVITFP